MTALTDFTSDASKVRLLISDIDVFNPIFNDEAIEIAVVMAGGSLKRAAAQLLLIIAVNEVLVQKHIKLLDLQTAGDVQAEALRKLAEQYRKEADIEASGGIGWLELPAGMGQFDKRSPEDWAALQAER